MITPLVLAFLGNIKISEVRLDSSVGLSDVEYVELSGSSNENLLGKSVIVIGPTGQLNGIIPLTGSCLSNGTYVISNSSLFLEQPNQSTPTYLVDQQNITLFLIDSVPTIPQYYDMDENNDGLLDFVDWNVIDSIQFKIVPGLTYSPTVLDGQGIYIWGAERCADNDDLWKLLPKQYPTELDSPGEPNGVCDGSIGNCLGDINGDNIVDTIDLSIMIGSWNTSNQDCDLNFDEIVNIYDLSILLGNWGSCGTI